MIPELLPQEVFDEQEGPRSLYNISVTVLEATQVTWQNKLTRVCVKFGRVRKYSKLKESTERPYYNQNFIFDYEGSLESMMDMVISIVVLHHKHGFRRDKLLACARLDLGAIWSQPGHAISNRWIAITHPSDRVGEILGYLNCEITIQPGGAPTTYIEKDRFPDMNYQQQNLGGGRLKARYAFGVHRGLNIDFGGKRPVISVRVFFAGLSGETTKRKNTSFPSWQEEIVFTELFPPMYNRFRIDIHIGKKIVCSKYLNLASISDPTVEGFLPTYGPSFLYLYSPPYNFLGSLLVSLETRTVYALREHEKLLDVRRQRGSKLLEEVFWSWEEFALFGVIFEVSMLKKEIGIQAEISIGLGFGISEKKEESNDNISLTWTDKTIKMDEMYMCLPRTSAKQSLFTREKMPDNRRRLYISNRLSHIAKEFGQEMIKLQFLLEHSADQAGTKLKSIMIRLIDNFNNFKSAAVTGTTILDKERLKTLFAKVDSIIKTIEQVLLKDTQLFEKYDTGLQIYREILSIVQDPQESFPQIILTVRSNEGVIAYTKVHPRDVLYSVKDNESGINCGIIQSFFLTSTKKRDESSFGGKIDVLLWLGPYASIGHGLSSIPSGFQDISQDFSFPKAIVYSEVNMFSCRAHFYQGHFLPCNDISGLCDIFIKICFRCMSEKTSVQKSLSPLWMETLVIKDIPIYGNVQGIKRNPHKIVIEFWNKGKNQKNLIGRFFTKPHVFLKDDKLQPPIYPPPLEWRRICNEGQVKGEILAMTELIQTRDTSTTEEEKQEVIEMPKYIKPPTKTYRFEILFWGIRTTGNMKLSSLNIPQVIVDCGPIHIESSSMKEIHYFPNFNEPPVLTEIELPVNWYFVAPFVVRLFDVQAFGTKAYIGSETKRTLRNHYIILPTREEWNRAKTTLISIRSTSIYEDLQKLKMLKLTLDTESMNSPLIDRKQEVQIERESKLIKLGESRKSTVERKWWQRLPFQKEIPELTGYIPLNVMNSKSDPEGDENFYDWWTKYYDSTSRKTEKSVHTKYHKDDSVPPVGHRTEGIKIYTQELEKLPEFNGFQDVLTSFTMSKMSSKRETTSTYLIKAGIVLYDWPTEDLVTMEGLSIEEGMLWKGSLAKELNDVVPVIIRVYVIRAHRLYCKDRHGKVDPYISVSIPSKTISDKKNALKHDDNPIFGRFFELEGKLPFDSILKVGVMDKATNELIGETEIDVENRYYSRHRATCGMHKSYSRTGYNAWRDAYTPSEILEWLCISNNLPEPIYQPDLVIVSNRKFGSNSKNIEDMKEELALSALHHWSEVPFVGLKLLEEHVETRTLYNSRRPNIKQGKLEMWVDILPYRLDLPKPVNIEPRAPENYELRGIVWSTQKVKLVDDAWLVSRKNTDIFVKGWLKGRVDMQKTDVHFASLTGEGEFNWRFIFPFSYDREEEMIVLDDKSTKIPPVLNLQVWDYDRLFSNDYIGALAIDLRNIQAPSRKIPYTKKKFIKLSKWYLNLFKTRQVRGWWSFTGSSKNKMESVGMVDLELQLLTVEEAERDPAGLGRNEPNQLPEPVRPVVKYTLWVVPFRAIKNYIWRYHKRKLIECLIVIIIATFCLIGFYSVPTFTVKKILGA